VTEHENREMERKQIVIYQGGNPTADPTSPPETPPMVRAALTTPPIPSPATRPAAMAKANMSKASGLFLAQMREKVAPKHIAMG